ncbi:hypothetical protein ABZT03_09945 [Streptomyces sp. NPDC005574]|uniref:hypothetical protein n=1 Tax=Streptomyces sp. NPDC005574 TaxID=3156891 RepID=UPI0033BA36DA
MRPRPHHGVHRALRAPGRHLDDTLADDRPALLDGTAPWVFPAGLAAAALHGYRREYLTVTRPGAVS